MTVTASTFAARLTAAAAAMRDLRSAVEAREPWPLAEHFGTEPEASWGPREVLTHVAEMLPYWRGEIERILDGHEPPFGRVADDPIRTLTIGRDRTLPIRELFARIDAGVHRYEPFLENLSADDLERAGIHPTRGRLTIADVLETNVVGHLEGHVVQLRETLT
ncbi:MAG: DinB family protein [Candidatus Limnocylindrales bacterium]